MIHVEVNKSERLHVDAPDPIVQIIVKDNLRAEIKLKDMCYDPDDYRDSGLLTDD